MQMRQEQSPRLSLDLYNKQQTPISYFIIDGNFLMVK
jgi:hypothetical protein